MKFCPECGSKLEDDVMFCGECGSRQPEPEVIPEPVVEEIVPEPVVEEIIPEPVAEEAAPAGNICPKCGFINEEGNRFCMECGCDMAAPVELKLYCPKCAQENAEGDAFCMKCGAPLAGVALSAQPPVVASEFEQKAKEAAEKAGKLAKKGAKEAKKLAAAGAKEAKKLADKAQKAVGKAGKGAKKAAGQAGKKLPMGALIGAGVAVAIGLVLVILAICGVFGGGKGGASYITYLKDGQMYYSDFSKDGIVQVTDRLAEDATDYEMASGSYIIAAYTALVKGDSRMFYPDRIDDEDAGLTIYYRDLGKKKDPVKVDSEIMAYAVNEKGNEIIYLKGTDGKLYRSDLKDKEKLASDVTDFYVTKDLQKVLFVDDDGNIYIQTAKGDKEKLVSGAQQLHYVSEDLQTIYYEKDENLYLQKVGADKEKIAKDLNSMIHVYEDGSAYFTTLEKETMDLKKFVNDDLAASDAVMVEPAYPEYPDYPTKPRSRNYETDEEYQKAMEEYEKACASYDDECAAISAAYDEAWKEYTAKQERDYIRASLDEYQDSYFYNYSLHYYDGKTDIVLADGLISSWARDVAWDAPVIAFDVYGDTSDVKVKLSEITSAWEVSDAVRNAYNEGIVTYLADGAVCAAVPEDYTLMDLSSDGKRVAYLTDINEKKQEGSLYTASVKSAVMAEGKLMDEDVYASFGYFLQNGKLVYFKEYNDRNSEADMFMEGAEVDYDVYLYGLSYSEDMGALIYKTDAKNGEGGTLKMLKGKKPEVVGEDIYTYQIVGSKLVYLTDYNERRWQGEMRLFGAKEMLDEDVAALLWPAAGAGEICGGTYYWDHGNNNYDAPAADAPAASDW